MSDEADRNETFPTSDAEEEEDAATPTPTTLSQSLVDYSSSSSSFSSQSSSFSAEVLGPRLYQDVLLEIAQYLDVKTLKAGRLVNAEWNAAFSMEFQKKAILVAALTFEKSVDKFVEMFSPNPKIIAENVWFQKQKFLKSNSMIKWMEECGAQIKSGKLGIPLFEKDFRTDGEAKLIKKVFSIEVISSFLDQCPNLESLTIVAPFTSSQASFEPKTKAKLQLDYLEIGCNSNNRPAASNRRWFLGSSCLLMNTLKCLKSVKTLSIVNMARYHFDGISWPEDESGKAVLEKVTELSLEHSMLDPRQLFSPAAPYLEFQNLRKLSIASFCDCHEAGQYHQYVRVDFLLSSLSDQLEELIFDQCSNKKKMKCPKLEEYFPPTTTMSKLEVFKILGITLWKNPSLEFLKQLPELKVLHISKASSISGLPVDRLFRRRNPRLTVSHKNLEELVFRCGTETSSSFSGIARCFPNLRTLESDFYGKNLKTVFTVLGKEGRVKNLKLFVYAEFECDYFKMLATSGIKKLCLEHGKRTHKLTVNLPSSENLSFLKSSVLREFNFVGMKFVKDEYELLKKKLTKSKSKLKLRLFGCDIEAEDPAIDDSDDDCES